MQDQGWELNVFLLTAVYFFARVRTNLMQETNKIKSIFMKSLNQNKFVIQMTKKILELNAYEDPPELKAEKLARESRL